MNDNVKNVWTPADEARLVELAERKSRIMEEQLGPVHKIADEIYETNWAEELTEYLTGNADKITAALAPFTTGA